MSLSGNVPVTQAHMYLGLALRPRRRVPAPGPSGAPGRACQPGSASVPARAAGAGSEPERIRRLSSTYRSAAD